MFTAYLDESYASLPDGRYFVIVAAVITPDPRSLLIEIRRIRKRAAVSARSDLHASSSPPELVKRLLQALYDDQYVSIIAVAWEGNRGEIRDHEELYRLLVAKCVERIVKQHRRVDIYIDKKYTNKHLQRELERSIREALANYSGNVVQVYQIDSQVMKELTAPDYVAWAYVQHYCRGKSEFYKIISQKVMVFDNHSQ